MNIITTQFGRPVLPPKPKRKSWEPTTEESLGKAMTAFCKAETRRKGLKPGGVPSDYIGRPSSFGAHTVTDDMKAKVIGALELAPKLQREIVAATGMTDTQARRALFVLKQESRIRYTLRRVGKGKIRLWHLNPPDRGVSAPHVAEHEKGKPVSFSQSKRDDVSHSAAPVAFPAAGAQEV